MRNGGKFNILMAMRPIIALIISLLWLKTVAFAQTETVPPMTPPVQVVVETKIVEVTLNDEHRQGVDWEAIVSDFHGLQLKKEGSSVLPEKKYHLSAGVVSHEDYMVLLEALDTVGQLISKDLPAVLLNKGELKSVDFSGELQGFPGLRLDLLWFQSPTGEEKIRIDPSIQADAVLKAQTQLGLKDNTAIVIGGLMHEEEISKVRKFPLLGDLPLVGLVFRKQGKLMQTTETILFMTVHTKAVETPTEDTN